MTRFEKDTLHTLLCMAQQELKDNGASFSGEAVKQEMLEGILKKMEEVSCFVSMID